MLHTFNNLIAHGGGGKLRLPGFHDVAGAETVAEHLVHGTFNGGGFGIHIEGKAEHHRGGQDRRQRIGFALPGDVGRGAVDGLEQAGIARAEGGGRQHTDGTGDDGSFV